MNDSTEKNYGFWSLRFLSSLFFIYQFLLLLKWLQTVVLNIFSLNAFIVENTLKTFLFDLFRNFFNLLQMIFRTVLGNYSASATRPPCKCSIILNLLQKEFPINIDLQFNLIHIEFVRCLKASWLPWKIFEKHSRSPKTYLWVKVPDGKYEFT